MKPSVFVGDIHHTRSYGDLEIISYHGSESVCVRFLSTGYLTTTDAAKVRKGSVKDKLLPSIYGVGYTGDGQYKTAQNGSNTKQYKTWMGMLERCYSAKSQKAHPTYKGCKVCTEWHNFQNFAKWFDGNYKEGLHLDKDIKGDDKKIYSPETCLFVTRQENNEKMCAKHYTAKSPLGVVVKIYNLSKFCRDNNLSRECMRLTIAGKQASHRGWTS